MVNKFRKLNFNDNKTVVLIDRTIFSCLSLRKYLNDSYGFKVLSQAVIQKRTLDLNFIFFLSPSYGMDEHKRRLKRRKLFLGWEAVYRMINFDNFSKLILQLTDIPIIDHVDISDELTKQVFLSILMRLNSD